MTEDKDGTSSGNGFEFTRRKKWPQLLLQELTGAALFCLKPIQTQRGTEGRTGPVGWKTIYVSPGASDLLQISHSNLENRDFFDNIFSPDQPHLQLLFSSLVSPSPPLAHKASSAISGTGTDSTSSSSARNGNSSSSSASGQGKSFTTYARVLVGSSTAVWEIRAHATSADGIGSGGGGVGAGTSFGLGGAGTGTMVPTSTSYGGGVEGLKGKAVWVMGRKVADTTGEDNAQSLDAFLELKLENERLREELRDLQYDMDEDDLAAVRAYADATAVRNTTFPSHSSSSASSPAQSSPSSSDDEADARNGPSFIPHGPGASGSGTAAGAGREKKKLPRAKDAFNAKERERKKVKKASVSLNAGVGAGSHASAHAGIGASGGGGAKEGGGGGTGGGEGLHVCVTCGRTDSPEWRKGPLGPKTLCNACGLRWAKRNATAPSRKDKKAAADAKKG